MNVITIAGRLGTDAETRVTPTGQKVTSLRMAVTVRKGGKEDTMWFRVTIWGDRYDKMVPYFKKGSALIVVGEMGKPDIWTDKEGRPQVGLEVTADIVRFNPFGGSGSQEGTGAANQSQGSNTAYGNNNAGASQQSSYSQPQSSQSGYGNNNQGDFGGSMQGGSSNYSQSHQSEEPIPF